ncbi:hypothetical protein [Actinoplanes sp. DH11]|uniref:hypothetical protein n=1 Tax=Actinoplanes sp. DH11 TaxID=2857011 RepID=UPI001E403200|nr:hypothetical protein [Actinoplanes sp. DH11]
MNPAGDFDPGTIPPWYDRPDYLAGTSIPNPDIIPNSNVPYAAVHHPRPVSPPRPGSTTYRADGTLAFPSAQPPVTGRAAVGGPPRDTGGIAAVTRSPELEPPAPAAPRAGGFALRHSADRWRRYRVGLMVWSLPLLAGLICAVWYASTLD